MSTSGGSGGGGSGNATSILGVPIDPGPPNLDDILVFGNTEWSLFSPNDYAQLLGAAQLVSTRITFNEANLTNGVPLYTPRNAEVLLDVWVSVVTAWDGATPQFDCAIEFAGGQLFASILASVDMTIADILSGGLRLGGAGALNVAAPPWPSLSLLNQSDVASARAASLAGFANRVVPCTFTGVEPLIGWVTSNGALGGPDPGATQGEAEVYVLTAFP